MPEPTWALRRDVDNTASVTANRTWWDAQAADYHGEHGDFLDDGFVWGPEGWTEEHLRLLDLDHARTVLEVGGGAGQCGRWIAHNYPRIHTVSTDLSAGMLAVGADLNAGQTGTVPLAQCDALALPFADHAFDRVFTAYGALPFVADTARLMREAARVLAPGGLFVFSTTHPFRWAFPDVPGPEGLTVRHSYFDRTPYVEGREGNVVTYAEHHRTMGDRVRELVAAGLQLLDIIEPEWPSDHEATWGGWSPLRGGLMPGTAIFVATI